MIRIFAALLLLAAASAASVAAVAPLRAQQPQPKLTISQVDAAGYPDVKAVVTALDASGVPVRSLTQAQFQAFDGSSPLTISTVQAAQDANVPLSVVLAIDVSGSMAGDALDQAKQAAAQFVRSVAANDQVAVVSFSNAVTSVVPFTNDKAKLTSGIAGLQAGGATALYEAVQVSTFAAQNATSPRRAVVLLTDGQNETTESQATADGSVGAAKGAGVPVFTVGFGDAPATAYLQGLSSATQGAYRPANANTVSSVYTDIATLLRAQYVLTLKSASAADGKDAALRIIANVGGVPAAAVSTYSRGRPAAAPTAPAAPPTAVVTPAKTAGGSSSAVPLIVFSALVALALLAGAVFAFIRYRRRRRIRDHQLGVVEPNQRAAAAQPIVRQGRGGPGAAAAHDGRGRLVERTPDGAAGTVWELGGGPASIGSSARTCMVVVPEAPDIAPEHARITLYGSVYRLRHLAGPARRTLVAGRPADIVTLEPGDEIQVGRHRFVYEEQ